MKNEYEDEDKDEDKDEENYHEINAKRGNVSSNRIKCIGNGHHSLA